MRKPENGFSHIWIIHIWKIKKWIGDKYETRKCVVDKDRQGGLRGVAKDKRGDRSADSEVGAFCSADVEGEVRNRRWGIK